MARLPDPIVVVLSSAQRSVRGIVAAILALVFGLLSVGYAVLGGGGSTDSSAEIGASVVGGVLLLLVLLLMASMGIGIGARDLTFSPEGLAWSGGSSRNSWMVAWEELASASLHLGFRGRPVNRNYRVRIELRAIPTETGASFDERHPALRRRRTRRDKNSYSLPLGPRRDLMDRIDNAFVIFAAPRYVGMVDEGSLGGSMAPQITGVRERGPHDRRRRRRRSSDEV